MRFIVKNFGPIKYADVTLGDFTVFIGPGGTGKSYLAYLIWMLQKMEPDWEMLAIEIPKITEFIELCVMIESKEHFRDFTELSYNLLTKVMEITQEAHKKTLEDYFKDTFNVSSVSELIYRGAESSSICICNNTETKKITIDIKGDEIQINGFKKLVTKDFLIKYIEDENKISFFFNDKELLSKHLSPNPSAGEIFDAVYYVITLAIPNIMAISLDGFWTAMGQFSVIFTDSKSGFLRFAPSLVRYVLRKKDEFPLNLPDREMLSMLIIDKKEIKDENLKRIAEFLETEVGYIIDVETVGMIFPEIYIKRVDKEEPFPILRSHSGVRELSPLVLCLKYVFTKDTKFIVMEEPETHLHPYMQSVVTRALVMLSKYADVLITTHSPIILDELDNLIKLSRLSPEEKKKLGYREEEGLDYNSLRIYRFKPDGTVEEVKVTEDGIEEEEFSNVIMELSNRYADVEEAVWRKLHEKEG
jgi:ABC-type lipoprotein export system ATPase subunit